MPCTLDAAACYLSVLMMIASFRDVTVSVDASKRTRDVTRTRNLPRYNLLASDDGRFIMFSIIIILARVQINLESGSIAAIHLPL